MDQPVFIGDEVSASGYRLAGIQTHVPDTTTLLADVEAWCAQAPLVLLSAEYADRLPAEQLQSLLVRTSGPVVVVPDVRNQHPLADLATYMRKQLGVLE